ncbi:AI-2E family transporter [Tardiphaga sp. 839_C3_N1_4]|jgi:predicted PurR-regulated permease PerM|uniref:AI-2E family transporter n=1 Tax=Tardiphaga sp. 839_C3_N1_4 TaxID=3240761 RepID=UPI003F1F2461
MQIDPVLTPDRGGRSMDEVIGLLSIVARAILAGMIIATLYYGRDIFVPIALAILLSFVLAPPVRLLQSIHVPRSFAVVGAVLLAFACIFALGSLFAAQLTDLAGDLPKYQTTMREKIQSLRSTTAGRGTLERASDMLKDLSKELDKPNAVVPGRSSGALVAGPKDGPVTPVPVEVRQPDPSALESLRTLLSPLVHPLATTGIIIIFVIFIMLQREDLRNRLIRLAGTHDLQRTTAALDDAAARLSRLFLTQLAVNGAFGLVIGLGLWAIGIPSPVLWGILAGVLRFVPYVGAVIAAAFPLILAVAVDPGWSLLAWTAALFLIVEPIVGHVIEPLVYGRSTGLSPVAVVVAATFWTALWGPIGLVLATPLTVCLVVLGRHAEKLQFLDVMFGDRPALSPPEIFYQRMLAGDPTEAAEKAEQFLKERSLLSYYEEVAVKGLHLARSDVERGVLNDTRQIKMRDAVQEFVVDLADVDEAAEDTEQTTDAEASSVVDDISEKASAERVRVLKPADIAPAWAGEHPLLCIAGRTILDEAASLMMAHLATEHGIAARTEPADALGVANVVRLETGGVAAVCLIYLDKAVPSHMRYAIKRLRRRMPKAKIILCCWAEGLQPEALEQLRSDAKADLAASSPGEALKLCVRGAAPEAADALASAGQNAAAG